jgi:NADH-quinone oxidoreductase subunit H
MLEILIFWAKYLSLVLPILIAVAFLTLVERKVLAALQLRVGPNVVGFAGLLQPFADAAKLLLKETILPSPANRWLFIFAPMLTFSLSLWGWIVIPLSSTETLVDSNLGIFYILAISSLGVYGIIIARLGI